MEKKKKLVLISILVCAVFFIVCMIIVISQKPYMDSLKMGIFNDISEMDALNGYIVPDAQVSGDSFLKTLEPVESWINTVNVDGSECIVRAYTFASPEDADQYYLRAANVTSVREHTGAHASSRMLFFAKADYVTQSGDKVIYVSGKSFKEISAVTNALFETIPNYHEPFEKLFQDFGS